MRELIFSSHTCLLGEGPVWHPERQSLLWCDILRSQLLQKEWGEEKAVKILSLPQMVSVVAIIDSHHVLIGAADGLYTMHLDQEQWHKHHDLEHDNPETRSNDGRVHPCGALWIGTMSRHQKKKQGAIYHFYKGTLRTLFKDISTPNSICFSPDGRTGYFADSAEKTIWQIDLDPECGLPTGEVRTFYQMDKDAPSPDGSVIDHEGILWNALFNGSRIDRISAKAEVLETIALPAPKITCPAFGGPSMSHLFATSAQENMNEEELKLHPHSGKTFVFETKHRGLPEPKVVL